MRALLAVLIAAATAQGQEEGVRVAIDAPGECPSATNLQESLRDVGVASTVAGGEAWVVRVRQSHGGATVELLAPGAIESSESRALSSPDCQALALSFALIVRTRLSDLGLELAPPTPPPEPEPDIMPPEVPAPPPPPPQPYLRWELALQASELMTIDPLQGAVLGAIDLSGVMLDERLVLRAQAAFASPISDHQVTQTTGIITLAGGIRGGESALWAQVIGGGALAVSAVSSEFPTVLRAQVGLTLGAAMGIAMSQEWLLRVEVDADLWLTRDLYAISPDGDVSRSPAATFSLGLAIAYAFTQTL